MDDALVIWANNAARQNRSIQSAVSLLARWLASVEIALMAVLALSGRRGSAARMLAAVAGVYMGCELLGRFCPRQRPFARLHDVQPLLEHGAERSFPSRHVASGLAMAAIGQRAHPRLGFTMSVVAVLLGLSRVAAGMHYPTDLVGGAALGIFIGRYVRQM